MDKAVTECNAPYVDYARADVLHALQFPISDASNEMSFILISQVKELLFRTIHVELNSARSALHEGAVSDSVHYLRRAVSAQKVLLSAWDYVGILSPTDFAEFRECLGSASGNQSFAYRALECIMGSRDRDAIEYLRTFGDLHPYVVRELEKPSLYDEALRYLNAHVYPLPDHVIERDWAAPYYKTDDVFRAWLAVYRDPAQFRTGYELAEALMDVAFQFSNWRSTHLLVVEKVLGYKPGSGGTNGVPWLRRINNHRFFPELWEIRTEI